MSDIVIPCSATPAASATTTTRTDQAGPSYLVALPASDEDTLI